MRQATILQGSFIILLSVNIIFTNPVPVLGQFMPIPPPTGGTTPRPNLYVAPNDEAPPRVEVLTKTIGDGKNIFKINIDDSSGISTTYIKYVSNGQIKAEPLLPRGGKLYEALIDMHAPSRIIEIQAIDAAWKYIEHLHHL